jgi:outer membrane protein OmpA-like peptidoglycan-associated protein
MSGYAEDKKTITDAIVKESVKDLRIPEYRRERHQENQLPGERLSHPGQPARIKKSPRSRLMKAALLLVLALLSFGLFVYFTRTTYQETVAYFASVQEKIGLGVLESIGKKMQPEPQGKTLPPDNATQPEPLPSLDIPSAVKADRPVDEKEQADPAMAARNDRQNDFAEPSGTTEQDGEAVPSPVLQEPPAATENNAVAPGMAEPVAVQSLPALEDPAEKSADPMPERSLRPFSDEPLVIRFKYDSNLFSDTDIARMRDFAEIWKGQPEVIVKVSGYTDSIGDDGYNRKLSQFRANMVKSFLMGQGLPPEKISAEGLGNRNPIEENDTAEGRMMNRRVEISVDTAETNR